MRDVSQNLDVLHFQNRRAEPDAHLASVYGAVDLDVRARLEPRAALQLVGGSVVGFQLPVAALQVRARHLALVLGHQRSPSFIVRAPRTRSAESRKTQGNRA